MLLHRPALSKEQIQTLKSDIKLLARHVSIAASLPRKIGPTTAYNRFAVLMGFTSFSQLKLNIKGPFAKTVVFDFLNDLEVKDVYEAFKEMNVNLIDAENGLQSVLDSLKPVSEDLKFISLSDAADILNRSYIADTQHVYNEISPKEFKATLDDAFFKDLGIEDHFVMDAPDGKKYYYTVVDSSPHIYDERVQVLTIRIGLWVSVENGGFCCGNEFKG